MSLIDDDVLYCLELGKRHIYLDTVSMEYLDDFHRERMPDRVCNYNQVRVRFRRALNRCVELGYCTKDFIGLTLFQTGDSFGGRSCLVYDFSSVLK